MKLRAPVRLVMFLVVALIGPACSSGGIAAPSSTSALSSVGSFGPASVSSAVDALARIGIDVRTLPSDAEPLATPSGETSVVRFLRFQVRNMALELSTGAGTAGADLDGASVAGGGGAISSLLVGWLRSAGTSASALARSLLRGQSLADPKTVVFPTFIIAAFLADATRGERTASGDGNDLQAFTEASSADFCSQVSDYLDQSLQEVLNPQARFAAPWLKAVIEQYAPMYQGDAALFRTTVGALALLTYATSIARSWSVMADPVPGQVNYSIEGSDPVQGEVRVTVATGDRVYADEVQPCASLAQIELAASPTDGASVYWDPSGLGSQAKATDADATLDVNQASLTYETTAESQDAAQNGDPQTVQMSVLVVVDREEMRSLAAAVAAILLSPAQDGPAASAMKSLYTQMEPRLGPMMFPRAMATIDVVFHTPPTTPSSTPEGSAVSGTWVGTWVNDLGNPPATGGFTWILSQEGESVSGTSRFSGPTCVHEVPIDGTVHGSALKLPMPSEWDIEFVGIVKGDSMSGTYTATACGMPDFIVTGTWQAERT